MNHAVSQVFKECCFPPHGIDLALRGCGCCGCLAAEAWTKFDEVQTKFDKVRREFNRNYVNLQFLYESGPSSVEFGSHFVKFNEIRPYLNKKQRIVKLSVEFASNFDELCLNFVEFRLNLVEIRPNVVEFCPEAS